MKKTTDERTKALQKLGLEDGSDWLAAKAKYLQKQAEEYAKLPSPDEKMLAQRAMRPFWEALVLLFPTEAVGADDLKSPFLEPTETLEPPLLKKAATGPPPRPEPLRVERPTLRFEKKRAAEPSLFSFFELAMIGAAAADPALLARCDRQEQRRLKTLGGIVGMTAFLAALSGGYALFAVFGNWLSAAAFGAVWGAAIFLIDRFLVASIRKTGKPSDFLAVAPRLLLAAAIALVIAHPLVLRVCQKEINQELLVMAEENRARIESTKKAIIQPKIDSLDSRIARARWAVQAAQSDFLSKRKRADDEVQSPSRPGDGDIHKALLVSADEAKTAVESAQIRLDTLENDRKSLLTSIAVLPFSPEQVRSSAGLLDRTEALRRAAAQKPMVRTVSLALAILLLFVELAPVLSKALSTGPYDKLLQTEAQITGIEAETDLAAAENAAQAAIFLQQNDWKARAEAADRMASFRDRLREHLQNHLADRPADAENEAQRPAATR